MLKRWPLAILVAGKTLISGAPGGRASKSRKMTNLEELALQSAEVARVALRLRASCFHCTHSQASAASQYQPGRLRFDPGRADHQASGLKGTALLFRKALC